MALFMLHTVFSPFYRPVGLGPWAGYVMDLGISLLMHSAQRVY